MATRIGSLIIRLAVEHGLLQQGLARSEQEVAKTTKAIQRKGKEIADFGKNLSLAVSIPIIGLAAASIKAAKESADALGQVNAALASMGNAAGRTTEQLQALASSQMKNSLIDDDQILREVTANLLTFGRIAGSEFDRAQQAALDLSTRLGTDLTSATVQIGKALNDPVKGVTALAKAGIQFTADQKAMISSLVETGNVAAAQRIILKELEAQFGGAAKAARDADPGAALAQSFANFQEEVGAKLLPLLPPLLAAITGILDVFGSLPEPMQTAVIAFGAVAAVVGPIAVGIGSVVSASAGLIATLGGMPMVISAVGLAMNTLLLTPLGLIVAAVGAVVAAWYYWDDIKRIVGSVGDAVAGWWSGTVAPVLGSLDEGLKNGLKLWINFHVGALQAVAQLVQGVKQWLQDKLGAIFDWVGKKIQQVSGFFYDMYIAVVGNSYVPDMVDGIDVEFRRLQAVMVEPANKATKAVTEATKKMAGEVMGLLDRLFPEFAKARRMSEELSLIDGAGLNDSLRGRARQRLLGENYGDRATVSFDTKPEGPLVDFGRELAETQERLGELATGARVQTVQIAESFKDMADKSIQALDRMVGAIKGGGFLDILGAGVNLFLQLGSTGVFGKKIATNINTPRIPGNANGTAFHPGGLMTVGERGPEILQVPRGGRVVPNHELREAGQSAIRIILDERTDIVEARIGRTVASAAPAIMDGSAKVTTARLAQRQSRRLA